MVWQDLVCSRKFESSIPKLVGGVDEVSGDIATALYDKRPPELVRRSCYPLYLGARSVLDIGEQRGWDRRIPARIRRRLYRLLLDYEYFAGVAEGLRDPRA